MLNKIKQWPLTVQLSVSFLFVIWLTLEIAYPVFITSFTLIVLTFISIVRTIIFFMNGD